MKNRDRVTLPAGKYNFRQLDFLGWSEGDGTETEGYYFSDYFAPDGTYKGADAHGIEPIVSANFHHAVITS